VQRITSISRRVTVRDVSDVVTGGVHCVTGGVPVGSLGLSKRFRAIIKSLIGVIDRSRGKEKAFTFAYRSAPW
jgi:hypothetical protein